MPRLICFRGKRVDGKGLIKGDLLRKTDGKPYIFDFEGETFTGYEVVPETVGQYTGLKDKNGKEIYEGDIIEMDGWEPKRNIVGFANGGFGFKNSMSEYYHSDIAYVETSRGNAANVVGNIYENPELLK